MRAKRKPTQDQKLLEAIMKRYGITSIKEAWAKYDELYGPPELDPSAVKPKQ